MDLTLVLVGPTGQGKSATGNRILRREAFIPRLRSSGGTETCELQTSVLEDGQTISVINTPSGFLDTEPELLGEEVKKCFHSARNRIHAILFDVRHISFTEEQILSAIRNLQTIFGENIIKYVIIVFTGDYRSFGPFKCHEIVQLCEGRYVIFYNRTEDAVKRSEQVQNLLSKVKTVISHNGGKPFMSQEFELQIQVESAVRDATTRLEQRLVEAHATTMNANKEQTTQIIDVVEARLRDTTTSLEQLIEAATLKAEERAEKYFEESTSKLIQRISKSYEEQMQRLEAGVEQRVLDMATRLEQQQAEAHAAQMKVEHRVLDMAIQLEQQQAEAHAAQMKVNEIAQLQMTQRINEEVESRVKDVTTWLEQQLAEAEAARLKADERAQEAQKNSNEQIQKLKEVLERAQETMNNSDEQIQKLKEVNERAQETQKNSDEQIQKLKELLEREESRRSETIPDFESSSFHVYDPSTYLLQSGIK